MAEISLGNLYDFNKAGYNTMKPLDIISLRRQIIKMVNEIFTTAKSTTWMLLCRERNDYTVFLMKTTKGIKQEMEETLTNRGQVLDIDKTEDGNYEIWIRDPETQENYAYYLFDYSFGIVEA